MFKHALFVLKNGPVKQFRANCYKDENNCYCALGALSVDKISKLDTSLFERFNWGAITKELYTPDYKSSVSVYELFHLKELGLTKEEAHELQITNDNFERNDYYSDPIALEKQRIRRYNHVIQWLEDKVVKESKSL